MAEIGGFPGGAADALSGVRDDRFGLLECTGNRRIPLRKNGMLVRTRRGCVTLRGSPLGGPILSLSPASHAHGLCPHARVRCHRQVASPVLRRR